MRIEQAAAQPGLGGLAGRGGDQDLARLRQRRHTRSHVDRRPEPVALALHRRPGVHADSNAQRAVAEVLGHQPRAEANR
jgi:hypothetical protein